MSVVNKLWRQQVAVMKEDVTSCSLKRHNLIQRCQPIGLDGVV
jgi:hypothetical protein